MKVHTRQFVNKMLPQSYERIFERLVWAIRGRNGSLPSFIIIGAQKSGTTSLYTILARHPQIIEAKNKELHFFSTNYRNGIMWYRSRFPNKSEMKGGKITGEATPYYLFHPHAPKRIFQLLPNVKLIVILRDPVDRAISHYFNEVRVKGEYLSIEDALLNEEERIRQESIHINNNEFYNSEIHRRYSYKNRGIYVDQIMAYLNYFDINRILVLKSEDFFSNPEEYLKGVFTFIGVDSHFLPNDLTPQNVGDYSTKVPNSIYKELVNYFAPHNERLYCLLGRDFGWKVP